MTARRWRRTLLHLLVAAVVAACVVLGFWQLDRLRGLQERNALLEARLAAQPREFSEVVPGLDPDAGAGSEADARHRPVTVEGSFAPEHQVLLRSRSYQDQPGYHVLTPLVLADAGDDPAGSRALLVDRGWVPYRTSLADAGAFAPPDGPVRVTGRLMPEADPPEGFLAGLAPRDPASGALERVARVDVDRLQPQVPLRLEPYFVEMEAVEGANVRARAGELPVVPPRPEPEAGPHLGYAIQWFSFATIAAVGYGLLLRRERREEREGGAAPGRVRDAPADEERRLR